MPKYVNMENIVKNLVEAKKIRRSWLALRFSRPPFALAMQIF
jgi:hypothetical protein